MRNYEELLKAGNRAQLEKLKENENKPGFDNIDIGYAFKRAFGEMHELDEEVVLLRNSTPNYENIRKEAADVANFCHMIIHTCDKKLKENK